MDRIKSFFKTAGIFFIGNVFSKLIAFILLPLYTNYLSPEIFGEYDYVVTILNFAAPICFFQIWDAMFRFSFDYNNENEKNIVVTNSFVVVFFGIILYTIFSVLLNYVMDIKFNILVYIYGIFISINYLYSYISRVYLNNVLFSFSGFINSLIVALTNIIMIIKFNLGLESLYISVILGSFVQCLIIEFIIRPTKKISINHIDKKLINSMIRFSLPLCIATISYWMLSGVTKLIIVNMLGNFENGLYAVTNKFASFLNMVVSIFQFAWNEMAYSLNKESNKTNLYSKATKYIIQFVIFSASFLIIFSKIIFPFIIGKQYLNAIYYLPTSIIGVSFNSIAAFLGTIFSAEKNTKYILLTTIYASVINIIISPILTKLFGLNGTIIGLAISFLVLFLSRLFYLVEYLNIKFEIKNLYTLSVFILTILVFYLTNNLIIYLAFILILFIIIIILNKSKLISITLKIVNRRKDV